MNPSRTLGRYVLLTTIAEGSMGTLYRSLDPRTQRPVAIKTVRADRIASGDEAAALADLRAEAESARGLNRRGIVAALDYGEENGIAYLVLEYVDGENLQQQFDRGVTFSAARAVKIFVQVLDAL